MILSNGEKNRVIFFRDINNTESKNDIDIPNI